MLSSRVASGAALLLPGLVLVAGLAVVARLIAAVLPATVSEITIGVLLGALVGNLLRPGARLRPGVRFSVHRLLRLGIILLGARLSVDAVVATGATAILLIIGCAVFAFATAMLLARAAGVRPRLAILIAVGTAICGNSAIVATAPLIRAEDREVSFAVATITLFGVAAVLLYPWIGMAIGLTDPVFGHWVGVAVNDTSQVTAAGFAYSDPAGETATIVKLTRNLLIGPTLVLFAVLARGAGPSEEPRGRLGASSLLQAVPLFVLGFVAMAGLNSAGLLSDDAAGALGEASKVFVLMALVAVGLGTDLRALRQVGARPLYVGLAAAMGLAVVGLVLSLSLAG
jgi:uncharacterized integral membrane protein (TIGR00698 family)